MIQMDDDSFQIATVGRIYEPYVFRSFEKEEHVRAMLDGSIYLGSLESWRASEDPGRGDPGEAIHTYHQRVHAGRVGDPDTNEVIRRLGDPVGVPEGGGVILLHNIAQEGIEDALGISCVRTYQPDKMKDIGSLAVRIRRPKYFFLRLCACINCVEPIAMGRIGYMKYAPREYNDLEPEPGPLGFVKPRGFKVSVRTQSRPSDRFNRTRRK
jgi:hypothetical protein